MREKSSRPYVTFNLHALYHRYCSYQDYNEWPVPGFRPNSIDSAIRCIRYYRFHMLHALAVTPAIRNDDMWLLSNVPIEGGGQSRKWVNWRDLYYPGGFIKCTSQNLSFFFWPVSFILRLTFNQVCKEQRPVFCDGPRCTSLPSPA